MLSDLRKDTEMRYRGLMTVCVLTCGLILAVAASAMAQTTQPAPAGPVLVPAPGAKTPSAAPVAPQTPGVPAAGTTATTSPAGGESKPPQPTQDTPPYLFVVLLGGVVLMWIWMGRGRRKQEAKRKEMLSNLKKGDKIVSIGGVIGTVIEAKPEEITVKVDETNNVRMKFARWAIRGVGEEGKTNPDQDKK